MYRLTADDLNILRINDSSLAEEKDMANCKTLRQSHLEQVNVTVGSVFILANSKTFNSEGIWKWNDKTITDYGFINNSNTKPTTSISPWEQDEPSNGWLHITNEDCVALDNTRDYEGWEISELEISHEI